MILQSTLKVINIPRHRNILVFFYCVLIIFTIINCTSFKLSTFIGPRLTYSGVNTVIAAIFLFTIFFYLSFTILWNIVCIVELIHFYCFWYTVECNTNILILLAFNQTSNSNANDDNWKISHSSLFPHIIADIESFNFQSFYFAIIFIYFT